MASTAHPTIRLAAPDDAAQISSLIARVWVKNFGYSVTPDDVRHLETVTLSPASIASEISDPSITYIVATLNRGSSVSESPSSLETTPTNHAPGSQSSDIIIGILQLVSGTSEACLRLSKPIELRRLYVEDGFHGMGIAQRLLRTAEDMGKDRGCESIWLGVWEDNARGQGFYRKVGFEVVGEHTFTVGQSVRRDWVMEKAI